MCFLAWCRHRLLSRQYYILLVCSCREFLHRHCPNYHNFFRVLFFKASFATVCGEHIHVLGIGRNCSCSASDSTNSYTFFCSVVCLSVVCHIYAPCLLNRSTDLRVRRCHLTSTLVGSSVRSSEANFDTFSMFGRPRAHGPKNDCCLAARHFLGHGACDWHLNIYLVLHDIFWPGGLCTTYCNIIFEFISWTENLCEGPTSLLNMA